MAALNSSRPFVGASGTSAFGAILAKRFKFVLAGGKVLASFISGEPDEMDAVPPGDINKRVYAAMRLDSRAAALAHRRVTRCYLLHSARKILRPHRPTPMVGAL
ncbi:hypothetical protein ACU5AX_16440 [Sphingomonas sp. XXL09]|uniref:hypothetical protein n=1 Tax=Sphingomonas sp. XXL09 TaxID=3457787 RepID=UPI00406BD665